MSLTVAPPLIIQDPGFLFLAPLLTAEPAHAVLSSTYDADVIAATWVAGGATEDGSTFSYEVGVEPVYVAEFQDPIKYSTVKRAASLSFNLADWTLKRLARAFNGAITSTVSGSGATLSSKLLPAASGLEIRQMVLWESQDHTFRIVGYQTLNSGPIASPFKKAPSYAVVPCTLNFEVPTGAPQQPFAMYAAGTGRLGV